MLSKHTVRTYMFSLILEGSGMGIEDGGVPWGTWCIIKKLRVPYKGKSFRNWLQRHYTLEPVRASLIDGESCSAWKCAFLLPFTDSCRPDRREVDDVYLSFRDSKIGTVRAFSWAFDRENPDRKLGPSPESWTSNFHFVILSTICEIDDVCRNICFRPVFIGNLKIQRETTELSLMKFWDFTVPSSTCELCTKKRKKEKKIIAHISATRGNSLSNLLLHAGSMSFYSQLQALQGRSDYVHQDYFSRHAGRNYIASSRPILYCSCISGNCIVYYCNCILHHRS